MVVVTSNVCRFSRVYKGFGNAYFCVISPTNKYLGIIFISSIFCMEMGALTKKEGIKKQVHIDKNLFRNLSRL